MDLKNEEHNNPSFYRVRPYTVGCGSPHYWDIFAEGYVKPKATVLINLDHVTLVRKWHYPIYKHKKTPIKRKFWLRPFLKKWNYETSSEVFKGYIVYLSNKTEITLKCGDPLAEAFIDKVKPTENK